MLTGPKWLGKGIKSAVDSATWRAMVEEIRYLSKALE
jgi:hypothetical protein